MGGLFYGYNLAEWPGPESCSEWSKIQLVASCYHDFEGSFLCPVLLNVFIDDLDMGLEHILRKFTDDSELIGSVGLFESRKGLQRNLDKLSQWVEDNCRGVNKVKAPLLGSQQTPCHTTGLGSEPLT